MRDAIQMLLVMSVIGNRPLPEDVIAALVDEYSDAEDRFLSRCGLTGPTQLVGRYEIGDADRLVIETAYCRHCLLRYDVRLDAMIALYTVLVLLRLKRALTVHEVLERMDRWSTPLRRLPGVPGVPGVPEP